MRSPRFYRCRDGKTRYTASIDFRIDDDIIAQVIRHQLELYVEIPDEDYKTEREAGHFEAKLAELSRTEVMKLVRDHLWVYGIESRETAGEDLPDSVFDACMARAHELFPELKP